MRTGIFVGSFNPFTVGHDSIVIRALPLFDRLVIGVVGNKTWSEKLQTNLQWAKAVRNSSLYEKLPCESQQFLNKFIQFLELRFNHAFLSPLWLLWIVRNARNIYPQVSRAPQMI